MVEEFNAVIRQSGPVVVVTIPSFLVKNDRVKPGKEYHFTIEEVESDAEQQAADS